MPGDATGGALLSRAMEGAAGHSQFGYRGPSAKYQESGKPVEEFAAELYGRDKSDLFKGRWDEIENPSEMTDATIPIRGKPDKHTVKVSALVERMLGKTAGKNYFLSNVLPDMDPESDVDGFSGFPQGLNELIPNGTVKDGVLVHPEEFFHGGIQQVQGTTAGSAGNAVDTFDLGSLPAEDYSTYQKEKDMRRLKAKIDEGKTASLLIKMGLAAPPAITAGGFGSVPNSSDDINTDQDLKRVSGVGASPVTFQARYNRPQNRLNKQAAEGAPGTVGTTVETASTGKSGKPTLPQVGQPKEQKLRGAKADALRVRPYTEGVQTSYQLLGPPALDPKFPSIKISSLLRRFGIK